MNLPWFDIINFLGSLLIAFFAGRLIESEKQIREDEQLLKAKEDEEILRQVKKIGGRIIIMEDKIQAIRNELQKQTESKKD